MTGSCDAAPVNSTEIHSEDFRKLIIAAGPIFRPGDRLKTFLAIVARRAGLTPRTVQAAWAGEPVGRKSILKLREAAAHGIGDEAAELAIRLELMARQLRQAGEPGFVAHVAALDETAGILRRMAGGT
jgi:hypothetical protein